VQSATMHSCMSATDELFLELFHMQEAMLEATVEASGMVRLCCSQSLDDYGVLSLRLWERRLLPSSQRLW
jgi:hypothetical protein